MNLLDLKDFLTIKKPQKRMDNDHLDIVSCKDETMPKKLDSEDPLRNYRSRFCIPKTEDESKDVIYLCGNSLGLLSRNVRDSINEELDNWERYGVEGHFHGNNPWVSFDSVCTKSTAKIVGAKEHEVVLMNTLTVNLHLMLTVFYKPTQERFKILVEAGAFPSDMIAINSHIKVKGYDPKEALLVVGPREGEELIRDEDIVSKIKEHGSSIALICMGGLHYYTGQFFDLKGITEMGHSLGCMVGFDLAHAAGNVELELNKWGVDFAVFCTYKYLNSGPGGIGGCFVHEKHAMKPELPRLAGWWSHENETRFRMEHELKIREGAMGFQLSNPSILCLAALKGSLQIYDEAGMEAFFSKSRSLSGYLHKILEQLPSHGQKFRVITPKEKERRGCQLSLVFEDIVNVKELVHRLYKEEGVTVDFREPNCIRVSPNPFYNSFTDVFQFAQSLEKKL